MNEYVQTYLLTVPTHRRRQAGMIISPNLLVNSFCTLLLFALVSCTQATPDSITSGKPTAIGQATENKTGSIARDRRRHDSNNNHEGILLSQTDTDGDDLPDSIAVCETASICVNHPASGINHTYTNPGWEHVVLLAIQDTDGIKGAEIIVMATTVDGALGCICIIHDRSQAMASYLGPQWSTATVKSVVDTDGEPGDEVVLTAYDRRGALHCVCIIRDRDGTYQTYSDASWASVNINWVEDTDGNPGAEVVLEVHGYNDTMYCICVIHHRENRLATYRDPLWKAVAVQLLIDTDGASGNEIVAVYSSELDGGVSIIHDRPQSMKTIAFTGEHPSIQQVGNYDNVLGAELCIFLPNQQAHELINDRSGEHVKIDNCQREQGKTHT
ncbi:MAG: hypothetical protein K2X00_21355 [Nitrospiraceae bacterium]|nr:hypothetical protein [Nitrospiraceae bacterium]